jgi:hypothetical protein
MVNAVVDLVHHFVVRLELVELVKVGRLQDVLVQQGVQIVRRVVAVTAEVNNT